MLYPTIMSPPRKSRKAFKTSSAFGAPATIALSIPVIAITAEGIGRLGLTSEENSSITRPSLTLIAESSIMLFLSSPKRPHVSKSITE